LHADPVLRRFAARQHGDLADHVVDLEALFARRRFPDEAANPADHLTGSIAVANDTIEGLLGLAQLWRLRSHPTQGRLGVGDDSADRLVDFMGDRRRELAHCRQPVGAHQLRLSVPVPPFSFERLGLRSLALGQIDHERHSLPARSVDCRRADENGHPAAVLAEVLLLERLDGYGRLHLVEGARIALAPFGRRQVRPAHAARQEIGTIVSDHPEECIVGLDDLTIDRPDDDPDDVCVHQAADLRLALIQLSPRREERF
jgi:hypothetical protein